MSARKSRNFAGAPSPSRATARDARSGARFAALDMEGVTRFLRAAFPIATAAHVECATGISAGTIDNWLRGRSSASGEHLGALATAFGPSFLSAAFPGVRQHLKREVRDERIRDLIAQLAGLLAEA